jgi:hypothetical protein
VILQEQKSVGVGSPFRNVSLARPKLRQPLHPSSVQARRVRKRLTVGAPGFALARSYDPIQRRLFECSSHRIDQANGELGMGVAAEVRCQ